jgi:hypothetical protein
MSKMGISFPISTMANWTSYPGASNSQCILIHLSNRPFSDRPVIESKEFYKLFPMLKRHLDQQLMTHRTAGEFLDTLKTLMAKLKVSNIFGTHT